MERQGYVRRYENAGMGPCFFAQCTRFSESEDVTMFGKNHDVSSSLNAEAMEILRGLLHQLRTKPASPVDWTSAANPQHWNLQQIAQAKRDVVAQFIHVPRNDESSDDKISLLVPPSENHPAQPEFGHTNQQAPGEIQD